MAHRRYASSTTNRNDIYINGLQYLSPERAAGHLHDSRKSDVWSLGVTFFEILIGRTPFEELEGEDFSTKEQLRRYWTLTVSMIRPSFVRI